MSHEKFHIALSHAILAGTGIYCLIQIKDQNFICPHVTYGLIAINNIIGVYRWASDYNTKILEVYRFTAYCQLLFALPCITTTVWLQNGYSKDWSWAWALVPIFPLLCYLVNADLDLPLAELLILFNLVGLGVVCFVKEIQYGLAATLAYTISHCCIRQLALYNYGLCFFAYFALRAIGFGHDLV
ncbi:hypothetical protein MTP99_008455 [Tenebrio molitor]|jgi:hypothetical protein|uniref:Uncharacterized protein n=1 Tax=Tenebrio molitor TaxID=7067 RepID=A0A8J6HGM1_TENMO|nr:hypothetical protein GEV33_008443 [Tenebrio molitor]KAJ3635552.1 hypothetical protein MTP99_008455 [Tenebrio molitor]CAH1367202.1 unnamed protein product [Tenebrio molitor]